MRKFFLIVAAILLTTCGKDNASKFVKKTKTDSNGFTYEYITNDPTGLRLYTLDNGLKVYLGQNENEPKIQTFIGVRAGSVYDPADNTGLAHYLEHMLFKGTDEVGTTDFDREAELINQISELYEKHKEESDEQKKKEIYHEIDKLSYEASKISIANEYDKMVSSLGAEGTNAWTWHEETIYTNKIPSNELDKWLSLESERFSKLVLRLFHTELETVYEEFNRAQDSDYWKIYDTLMDELFPVHPYGQQTTIGKPEHLKNPSMKAIHDYFDKYYVPNNMAIVLVGDFNYDEAIKKVSDKFGKFEGKGEISHPERPREEPIKEVRTAEVFGPEAASVNIAFRSEGIGTEEEKKLILVDMLLSNSVAGLIDLNLNQKQMVQGAGSYTSFFNDYGIYQMYGAPKLEQSLEEVKDLLLDQIEEVKKGNFEEWMIDAVVNDMKLDQIMSFEDASSVARKYIGAFIHFQDWESRLKMLDDMRKITKAELVDFANEFFTENYVVVYKRQGKSKTLVKVEKPDITPIELNREKKSEFFEKFGKMASPKVEPKFVNYKTAIRTSKFGDKLDISFIENEKNDFAELYFIFDFGSKSMKEIPYAIGYMDYVGTDKYSPEELRKEFYKLGVRYGVYSSEESVRVYLSGLRENLGRGMELLQHLWSNAKADRESYEKYVQKIAKTREDDKSDKGKILWSGLGSYAKYGENSLLRDVYKVEELIEMSPDKLLNLVKGLKDYKHRISYYGKELKEAETALEAHVVPEKFKPYPDQKNYERRENGGSVYFVNYDMVQAQMLLLAKGDQFNAKDMAVVDLFNTYFGAGISSIVFQEIRESKSLAYSAFARYSMAKKKEDPNYTYAYIGTQANKLPQAVEAMIDLMTDMPEAEEQLNAAKESVLKQIASERITDADIFWNYERLKKRGLDYDVREEIYNAVKEMDIEDLKNFFDDKIKGNSYDVLVIGNQKDINFNALSKLGKVSHLDVDYLFNY